MRASHGAGFGVVVAAAAVVLAACGGDAKLPSPSDNDESTATASSESESAGSGGAPAVPEPLDPDVLLSEPCDLLSAEQRDELGLVEYSSQESGTGDPQCTWATSEDGDEMISISAMGPNENGLDDIYAQREQYHTFEPTTINNYPTVFATDYVAPGENGQCPLYVGVTEELSARLIAQFPVATDKNSCLLTEETAESVIETMQD